MLLALLLAAAPASCDVLWDRSWKALNLREKDPGAPLAKVKDLEKKLRAAWLPECRKFTPETLSCARGEDLEKEVELARKMLEAEKVPPEQIEKLLPKLRADWSILDCKELDRSLDRAAAKVAKDEGLDK